MSLYIYLYPLRIARRLANQPEQYHLNVNIQEDDALMTCLSFYAHLK
jgi:hypothetical protein